MRIQVRTSINVRSNTIPSSPTDADDALPQPEECKKIIKKLRSKSPIPFLPPPQDMAKARLKASQRPPPGSRLSAWLHGFSMVDNSRDCPSGHNRKISHTSTSCYHQTPRRRSRERPTGLRPAASTRGVIDPVHSPTANAWPTPSQGQDAEARHRAHSPLDAYQTRLRTELGLQPSKTRQGKIRNRQVGKQQERACFPNITDPKIRQKALGCLLFGTILVIVLTIYLALAISNTAWDTAFHGAFIFCILVLAVLFAHFIIRLCMLALKPKERYRPRRGRDQIQWPSPTDEEAAFAQPTEPIPIMLADDEGSHRANESVQDILDEADGEKDLPAPPPIYGNWRGSVRADPNLIHWQLHTNQPDVQREARELIFAGSGHRPPSYTSAEMAEGSVVGSPRVTRPLPLFAERRRAAGVADP